MLQLCAFSPEITADGEGATNAEMLADTPARSPMARPALYTAKGTLSEYARSSIDCATRRRHAKIHQPNMAVRRVGREVPG
jgi:hypothetical protein